MKKESGHMYAVSFSSRLGSALKEYFAEYRRVNKVANDFVMSLEKFSFAPCDVQTTIIQPTNAEAGGVMAVVLSDYAYKLYNHIIDKVMWDTTILQDSDGHRYYYYFPRISVEIHYLPYAKARTILENGDHRWKVTMDREHPDKITSFPYGEVRSKCLPEDLASIKRAYGKSLADESKCALAMKYVFASAPPIGEEEISDAKFCDAVALYEAFSALPIIANDTLASILSFKMPGKDFRPSDTMLEWLTDETNNRYVFFTQHTSSDPDFVPITTYRNRKRRKS